MRDLLMVNYFRFLRTKLRFDLFFLIKSFLHQQVPHFGVLNYERQHKEGLCKFWEDLLYFLAFYADFCPCPKAVIITTLTNTVYM